MDTRCISKSLLTGLAHPISRPTAADCATIGTTVDGVEEWLTAQCVPITCSASMLTNLTIFSIVSCVMRGSFTNTSEPSEVGFRDKGEILMAFSTALANCRKQGLHVRHKQMSCRYGAKRSCALTAW